MATYKNLYADQGSTFIENINVTDSSGTALNLNDYAVKSQFKKSYYAETSYNFDIAILSNTQIVMCLSSENSNNISPGRYVYDVTIVDNCDNAQRIQEGILQISPGVTK